MSMRIKQVAAAFSVAAVTTLCGFAHAAEIFADSVPDSLNANAFGGGSAVGAPDGGGLFFPGPDGPGYVTYRFNALFADGAGTDIRIYDLADPGGDLTETARVYVSLDGVAFTAVADVSATPTIDIDINGLFAGPFQFVRVENTFGRTPDGDGLDIDTVSVFNAAPTNVPTPGVLALLGIGVAGMAAIRPRNVKR